MRYDRGRYLEKCGLLPSAHNEAVRWLPSRVTPFGQLLQGNFVWILTGIESPDQPRAAYVPASNIKCPADQRAVLILVERDLVIHGGGNALLSGSKVGSKEAGPIGFGQGNGVGNLCAFRPFAEVTVTDGGESNGIVVDVGDPSFVVLDHPYSSRVGGCSTAVIRRFGRLVGLRGLQTRLREAALEAGGTWAQPCHRVSRLASANILAGAT